MASPSLEDLVENSTTAISWTQQSVIEPLGEKWIQLLAVCVIVVLGLFGNTLVLLIYAKNPQLRTPTNTLIGNQSVSDILSIITFQVTVIANHPGLGALLGHKIPCLISFACIMIAHYSSSFNLLIMSAERLIAVSHPFKYFQWVTEKTVKRVIFLKWSALIVLASQVFIGTTPWEVIQQCRYALLVNRHFYAALLLTQAILLPMHAACNASLCITAVRVQKKIQPQCKPVPETNPAITPSVDFKRTKMFLTIVGCYFLTWVPFTLISLIVLFSPTIWRNSTPPKVIKQLYNASRMLLLVSPTFNPIIYAWKGRGFRRAFQKMMSIKKMWPTQI